MTKTLRNKVLNAENIKDELINKNLFLYKLKSLEFFLMLSIL